MNEVYIINTATYLPNKVILNEEIEDYMGLIGGEKSKAKNIVLRNNGIKQRFYALTKDGKTTHSNAQISSNAIKKILKNKSHSDEHQVELLSCGTSSPDQMMPSHGVMVHGELPELGPIEVVSPSGNCCAGMHALKYAYLSIKAGEISSAISAGSERTSKLLHASVYESEIENLRELEKDPYIAFDKDFLRWMLSDGAGAFLLSNKPAEDSISLKIDWIEGVSYANEIEACMYMASEKEVDGSLKSFKDYSPADLINNSVLSIKQDVKLLRGNIVSIGFKKLKEIWNRKGLNISMVDYFLPHMSSEFFRPKIADALEENEMPIPMEKWFTNLSSVGNVGAASIYLMVDELMKSGNLKKGEKLLIAVPESARFSYVFAMLTVV